MNRSEADDLLLELFRRLLNSGLCLGVAELLAARKSLVAGFGAAGDDDLRRLLRLVWCKSAAQSVELDTELDELLSQRRWRETVKPEGGECSLTEEPAESPASEMPSREIRPPHSEVEPRPAPAVMPLPVRAPEMSFADGVDTPLAAYGPVSRRTMAHTWRYLRRPVKDGPPGPVDLPATVERAARQGFFDRTVQERRTTDHAHLVLLVDQGGSMVPFHRLTRDLVQTAGDSGLGRVDIGYFQNVAPERIYLDPRRTRSVALEQLLAGCTAETGVLLVSDAGAARGGRDQQRFQATARLLVQLKRLSWNVAWLNPVPRTRWEGTSAQLIESMVSMFPMDDYGFSNAVDVLRGQPSGSRS